MLSGRRQAARERARKAAEQSELQRRQIMLQQLTGVLKNSRRDSGTPR